jgi:hypothetical protein
MTTPKSTKKKPRVLCISCDAAYSLHSKFITVHETTELKYDSDTFPKGTLVRFSCSKCKGETTSVLLYEDDIKKGYSPILHQIKKEQQDRYDKQRINETMSENEVNKGKKGK